MKFWMCVSKIGTRYTTVPYMRWECFLLLYIPTVNLSYVFDGLLHRLDVGLEALYQHSIGYVCEEAHYFIIPSSMI